MGLFSRSPSVKLKSLPSIETIRFVVSGSLLPPPLERSPALFTASHWYQLGPADPQLVSLGPCSVSLGASVLSTGRESLDNTVCTPLHGTGCLLVATKNEKHASWDLRVAGPPGQAPPLPAGARLPYCPVSAVVVPDNDGFDAFIVTDRMLVYRLSTLDLIWRPTEADAAASAALRPPPGPRATLAPRSAVWLSAHWSEPGTLRLAMGDGRVLSIDLGGREAASRPQPDWPVCAQQGAGRALLIPCPAGKAELSVGPGVGAALSLGEAVLGQDAGNAEFNVVSACWLAPTVALVEGRDRSSDSHGIQRVIDEQKLPVACFTVEVLPDFPFVRCSQLMHAVVVRWLGQAGAVVAASVLGDDLVQIINTEDEISAEEHDLDANSPTPAPATPSIVNDVPETEDKSDHPEPVLAPPTPPKPISARLIPIPTFSSPTSEQDFAIESAAHASTLQALQTPVAVKKGFFGRRSPPPPPPSVQPVDVSQTCNALAQTLETISERGRRLKDAADSAAKLSDASTDFEKLARKIAGK